MNARRILSSRTFWISVVTILWMVALSTNSVPRLRGGYGWTWKYDPVPELGRLIPLVLAMTIYIMAALWLIRRKTTGLLLAWTTAGGIFMSLAAVYVRGDVVYRLYSLTVSGQTGGWQMAAARINDLHTTLENWPVFMAGSVSFSTHMGISPPGLVVLYYAAARLLEQTPALAATLAAPLRWLLCQYVGTYSDAQIASSWFGMLMPVWGALTVLPLYYLGQQTFGKESSLWAVAWWPLVPSFLSFAPSPNTFYALPALLLIGLLTLGLHSSQMRWVFAAGLLGSLLTFLTFTFLPLFLFAGLITLGWFWWKRASGDRSLAWHWPLLVGVCFGVGLSIVWILAYFLSGTNLLSIWAEATRAHLDLSRPYLPWLVLHLNDFFMFTGWPLALLAGIGLSIAIRRLSSRETRLESDIIVVAFSLTVLILDLSGTLRGESGRILLFLSPWLLLTAGSAIQRKFHIGGVMMVLEGLVTLVLIAVLLVMRPEFKAHTAPAAAAASAALPASAQVRHVEAQFGDAFRLTSYAGNLGIANDKPVLLLWLNWSDLQPTHTTYDISVTPIAPDGTAQPAMQIAPFQGEYPTTCWKPGEPDLVDRIRIPVRAGQQGDWSLRLSLIDRATGEPLPVVSVDNAPAAQLLLGPFH